MTDKKKKKEKFGIMDKRLRGVREVFAHMRDGRTGGLTGFSFLMNVSQGMYVGI